MTLEPVTAGELARLLFSRVGPTRILFLADANNSNERALLPADSLDYNPSFSADGKWIVFTSERTGSADIYRVHPDTSGLERLTDDPAFDDQAALAPDGSTLVFVSTREGGFANLWLQDLSSRGRSARPIAKTNAGSFRPSWSPDGKWIAFSARIKKELKTSIAEGVMEVEIRQRSARVEVLQNNLDRMRGVIEARALEYSVPPWPGYSPQTTTDNAA